MNNEACQALDHFRSENQRKSKNTSQEGWTGEAPNDIRHTSVLSALGLGHGPAHEMEWKVLNVRNLSGA